jgi:hypothetical protein
MRSPFAAGAKAAMYFAYGAMLKSGQKSMNTRPDKICTSFLLSFFSSKSRFASSSKNCRILRAPVRAIAAATKSRTGTSAAAMKFLELGVNAAQLHMSPAGDSRPSGLDDGKPSAKLKFEPGKQYSSHPSSPPKKSLEKNLVITGIFLQGLAATGCSRISRGRSSTAAVSGDDDDEDDDDNELAAAALLELSKTTGR